VLGRDDGELSQHVAKRLKDEGIRILEQARVERIEPFGSNIQVVFASQGKSYALEGTALLLALGRTPVISGLNLDVAGVRYSGRGVIVNKRLKTSNRRVYAIGDVTGLMNFTHAANYHATLVLKNALFRLPVRADHGSIPWVTFTDPELAHVGMTEEAARQKHGKLEILRWSYNENDRAHAERETEGHLKVIASKRGRILGAGMVGANAGELIQMWSLAMQKGIPLRAMASFTSPYPTLAEINKRAAMSHYATFPHNPLIRRLITLMAKLD
jgi:pyruvate/2-oxoglutarate dehydrogenase complex dihydrolipoamide dehydrogenase (E3) component